MIENFNTFMSLLLATISGWAIMSNKVRDGIVIKIGLSFVSIGFFGVFMIALESGGDKSFGYAMVHAGMLICALGYLFRRRRQRTAQRRITDWGNLA